MTPQEKKKIRQEIDTQIFLAGRSLGKQSLNHLLKAEELAQQLPPSDKNPLLNTLKLIKNIYNYN